MRPNSFVSAPHPLSVALAFATLTLICPSSAALAAELAGGADETAHRQSQPPATASTVAVSSFPIAQAPPTLSQAPPRDIPPQSVPRDPIPPDTAPLPTDSPQPLPSPDELLPPTEPTPLGPDMAPEAAAQTVFVEGFSVEGSTVFDSDALADLAWWAALNPEQDPAAGIPEPIIRPLREKHCLADLWQLPKDSEEPSTATPDIEDASATGSEAGRELSFEQLLRARSMITQLYIECGYITSGAILPPQTPEDEDNIVKLQVIEGRLESIEVIGLGRLNPDYIRSRLDIATPTPLNRADLVEALELLQLNPLVRRISADLQTGTQPAASILQVEAFEADDATVTLDLNNNRSPSVGSFERGLTFNHNNLSGLGDRFSLTYNNTDGSNQIEAGYTIPVSPRNATVGLRAGYTRSDVIEDPFDDLEIDAETLTSSKRAFRYPIFQRPAKELFLGLTRSSHQSSQNPVGDSKILASFPSLRGADNDGRTTSFRHSL